MVEQRIRNARVGGSSPLPGTTSSARPSSLWVRALSRVPLWIWYPFASFLAFLAWRVFPYRRHVVVANLKASYPEWDDATRERVIRDYYRGFADVFVEVARSLRLTPAQIEQRMKVLNPELVRNETARGKPVLIMAAHQCNWEWLLLGFSTQLGVPVDAVYKPLVNPWAEREMFALRSRLGARPVDAQQSRAGRRPSLQVKVRGCPAESSSRRRPSSPAPRTPVPRPRRRRPPRRGARPPRRR